MPADPSPAQPERSDSPSQLWLILGGTLAIHVILLVFADVVIVTNPPAPREEAPVLEYVEIEVPKPPPPKPPEPEPAKEPEPEPEPAAKPPPPRPQQPRPTQPRATTEPPPQQPETPTDNAGGAPVPTIPLPLDPGAIGVPVAVGKRVTGKTGRGGTGGGAGTGSGEGSSAGQAPPPVSIATIKTRAMPKGDYGYIDAKRDYPAAARQLGIQGPIRVRLIVDDQGKVKSAVLLNKLGHGLDELALERARKIEFEPARDTDDKPVTSVVVWTFNMTLPR